MQFSAGAGTPWTPLTPLEYGRFAFWLQSEGRLPRDLRSRSAEVLADWTDSTGKLPRERLEFLLDRGVAMGVALEKWGGVGTWALTRADTAYPARRPADGQRDPGADRFRPVSEAQVTRMSQ